MIGAYKITKLATLILYFGKRFAFSFLYAKNKGTSPQIKLANNAQ